MQPDTHHALQRTAKHSICYAVIASTQAIRFHHHPKEYQINGGKFFMTSKTRYPVFIALALLLMSIAGLDSSAYARHRRFRDGCCPVAICPTCPAPAPVISCPAPQPVVSCPAPQPVILRRVTTVTTCCPVACPCPEKKEEAAPAPVVEEKPAPEPAPAPVINVPEPEPLPTPLPRPTKMKL